MNYKNNILLIEDSQVIHTLVAHSIDSSSNLHICETGSQALDFLKSNKVDLIILDIMLPDINGYDLCKVLKKMNQTKNIPVIFLTSKDSLEDKLRGFEIGASDYITKPFNILEFKARVKSKLNIIDINISQIIEDEDIKIELISRRVFLKHSENYKEVDLGKREFEMLKFFMTHLDHVLSREQIIAKVWDENTYVSGRTIDTHVSKLRKKLEFFGERIHTSHGSGYRLARSKKAA
jgi:DNA-binding response OmpR family regulator